MNRYIGNPLQVRGAEPYVLQGGKGDGMHFLYVRNGLGLEAWISLDRAGDISRLSFKGDNMGYFSPCGYVAPAYYDGVGAGFLKSFTAGFFTTCGLSAVGSPCVDEGEELPLHGTISHQPAQLLGTEETAEALTVRLAVRDAVMFGRKLVLARTYRFSYTENTVTVSDTVTNEAADASPYMVLYHCNMGYPLVSEDAVLKIPHHGVTPRDDEAATHMDSALQVEPPQSGFVERCYFYDVKEQDGSAKVGLFNPTIGKGLVMAFDKATLPCFTEWKMMGQTDYVLGLEPGNCTPEGRDVLRQNGTLRFLKPAESATTTVSFAFTDNAAAFDAAL
ncbi:MAG: aldose 1-epimerase family protein [Clostridia bacterium]|nr:aldose 1-epimerase family protein [Clostridia bacterium]